MSSSHKTLEALLSDASSKDLSEVVHIWTEHRLPPTMNIRKLDAWSKYDQTNRTIKVVRSNPTKPVIAFLQLERRWHQSDATYVVHVVHYAARKSICNQGITIPYFQALLQDPVDEPMQSIWRATTHIEVQLQPNNNTGKTFLTQLGFKEYFPSIDQQYTYTNGHVAVIMRYLLPAASV